MPELTIIIPVYNTPQSLLEANIKSVLSQCGDIEIVYINDGSTDTWVDLMLTEAANSDSRVTYIKKQNTGVSSTRNEVVNILCLSMLMIFY